MSKTTITISVKVKKVLDMMRKDKSWDEFLLEIARKAKLADKLLALREFEKLFSEKDAEEMEKILDEVRLKWKSRVLS